MTDMLFFARDMAACLCAMEVRLVCPGDDYVRSLIPEDFHALIPSENVCRQIGSYLARLEPGQVYLISGIFDLCYCIIAIPDGTGYLIAGPCQPEGISESRIRSMIHGLRLGSEMATKLISYCRWQPILPREKLHQFGILLARHVLQLPEPIRYKYEAYHWHTRESSALLPPEEYVEHSRIRQVELRYEASAALTEAVKHGNLSIALQMIQGIHTGATSMIRNPDPLRNAQNMCIVLNTQLRHALEQRRIHPYRLDTVSGEIARQIEKLRTLDEVGQFYSHILRQYCELALEKHYAHLDALTRQAVVYIKTHLSDTLTVKGTAQAMMVNANYLSGKFHRDMGMTFTDFVNCQRTEQAASLLRQSNMQIQEIAAAVGYNNTSYFAKQFLRFYHISPRAYRKQSEL